MINVNNYLNDFYKKNTWKNLLIYLMAMIISSLAFNLFFSRYNIIPTGSSGLALLISQFVNIDISILIFIICLVLLVIGLLFNGFDYAVKMLGATLVYPFCVKLTSYLTNRIDLEDTSLFLIMILGGGMLGLSSGLIRRTNYSPGGFCVIFDLMHKYFHISIGLATTIVNSILLICGSLTMGFNCFVYSLISLIVSSYVVDKVVIGISDNKVFYIVTEKYAEVKEVIVDKLNYSVTILNARGGFTNKKRKMLMCVVPTIEYVKIKDLVLMLDDKAFFLVVDAYDSSVKKNCKNM